MKTRRFLIGLMVVFSVIVGNLNYVVNAQNDNISEVIKQSTIVDSIESEEINGKYDDDISISNYHEKFSQPKNDQTIMDKILSRVDILIPLTGIVIPFLFAFLIIASYFNYKNEKEKSFNQLLIKAMETGQQLPKEFFESKNSNNSLKYDLSLRTLKRGLITAGVGLGIMVFGINNYDLFAIGVIILFIGVAQLLM